MWDLQQLKKKYSEKKCLDMNCINSCIDLGIQVFKGFFKIVLTCHDMILENG